MSPWATGLLGEVINGYRICRYLGGGGFGLVFEATNISTGSSFALKVLEPSSDAQAAAEFDSEGVLLKKLLNRSGVINWIESSTAMLPVSLPSGAAAHLPVKYHVMALASGALDEVLDDPARRAAIPWEERISHWRGAVLGVHQMHLSKVAHRDLKSGNCLLMVNKGNTELRLTDLGRAKDFSLPPTLSADVYASGRGDVRFAPPEYLWLQGGLAETDFRMADLYGLGSLLVELATGQPMTGLAIGSWGDIQKMRMQGVQDRQKGVKRDIATLRPKFYRAIEHVAVEFPPAIRDEGVRLLRQLCDPEPSRRTYKSMGRIPKDPDAGCLWLLDRADIMLKRLKLENKGSRSTRRSAS
ncbi:protein kinase domain-containing protein [Mycobacterium hubeiense]|uniref:protein kinase domain-containing protein n=1 Tax=Mycobacterium hubeiense TaxID=1867256 RepID=UPI000C7EB2CC|nr:protein kinase [Mycobacterium sp. QGD 101]